MGLKTTEPNFTCTQTPNHTHIQIYSPFLVFDVELLSVLLPGPDWLISLITASHLLWQPAAVWKTQQASASELMLDSLVRNAWGSGRKGNLVEEGSMSCWITWSWKTACYLKNMLPGDNLLAHIKYPSRDFTETAMKSDCYKRKNCKTYGCLTLWIQFNQIWNNWAKTEKTWYIIQKVKISEHGQISVPLFILSIIKWNKN